MRIVAAIFVALVVLPGTARADIFMWRDDQGVKHYTNTRDLVPPEQSAALVLHEPAASLEAQPSAAAVERRERREARQAQVAADAAAMAAAYAEGYQRAIAAAQPAQAPAVNVQIVGPLVAASAGGISNDTGYGYGGGPSWLDYNSPALVTTSFDGGRSRHLTLRMLMQDQFAIDREGPYLVVNRFPPQGPNLTTIMPRGLPWFVRPGSGVVDRVITH